MRDDNVYLFSIQRLWEKVSPIGFNDSPILLVESNSLNQVRLVRHLQHYRQRYRLNTKAMLFYLKLIKRFGVMSEKSFELNIDFTRTIIKKK